MEEMAYALQAMEDLLARRRKERMENEAVRERTRQFDVTAGERARAHDLDAARYANTLAEQTRQHEGQRAERIANTAYPEDIATPEAEALLQKTGFGGALRTVAHDPFEGVDPARMGELPKVSGRLRGGSQYLNAEQNRIARAQLEQDRQAAIRERTDRTATEAERHNRTTEELKRLGADQQRSPYFQAFPTYDAAGVPIGALRFNARTGQMDRMDVPGGGQMKPPPGSLGKDIVGQDVASTQLGRLKGMFKPEFVGPAAGRIGMARQKTPLVPQDEGFSNFAAATAAFRNSVIKAITGAQMSEPEANRIRQQIPEVTDPPTVWQAKAAQTEKNLADLERIVQNRGVGTGLRTVVKRQRNRATGQTRVVYSDGTVEVQ